MAADTVPEIHFAWANSYVFIVSVMQVLFMSYLWRHRTRPLPFALLAAAVMTLVWSAMFFIPIETHTVKISMALNWTSNTPPPRSSERRTATAFSVQGFGGPGSDFEQLFSYAVTRFDTVGTGSTLPQINRIS